MTIKDKWSSLFHHTLQIEQGVTQEIAEEALILIRWAFEEYQAFCENQGFQISQELIQEKDLICAALNQKANQPTKHSVAWPIEAMNKWEYEKPFHEAMGSRNLKSEWEPFIKMAKTMYRDIHTPST